MTEPFRIAFVPGVSPGKWLRIWSERMPRSPLEAAPVEVTEQRRTLLTGDAQMCFVRLPIDPDGLRLIPLYREQPVVVAARYHPIAAFGEIDVAELADERLLQDPAEVPEWAGAPAPGAATGGAPSVGDPLAPLTAAAAIELAASDAGIVIVPMSVARLYHRADAVHRPVTGVAHSHIALAWRAGDDDPRLETFIGIVRGRTANSSRGTVASATPAPRSDRSPRSPVPARRPQRARGRRRR